MKETTTPTITPRRETGNHGRAPRLLPTREQLAGARLFRKGQRTKADLLRVETADGPLIVKDFGGKPRWVRHGGRWMIARELRAYRRLTGCLGVTRALGRVDRYALALDYLDATQLAFSAQRTVDGAGKLAQLRAIVDGLHARGVVHCDLRSRDNVLVDPIGRLYVVDFAAAVCLRPGSLVHRLLFARLAAIDRSACLKWKRILDAGPLTDDERAFVDRFRAWRPFWIHRREAWRGKTRPPA
ncbi:MAG TPA: hypothetical protein VD788_00095 [Candidatus Polarisedimenticolaceae bacterium]|nr:hypothetical protein [Candidatus Polarisedimenticolaceae bacterium]